LQAAQKDLRGEARMDVLVSVNVTVKSTRTR